MKIASKYWRLPDGDVARFELRLWTGLLRHAALLYRTGMLRFRLETFGVYYPNLPYRSPSWRLAPANTFLLVRQARSYGRWLIEMDDVRHQGAHGWWKTRHTAWESIPRD